MTRLASFGPVSAVAAFHFVYFVNIIYKTLVSIKKNEKKLTMDPNDTSGVVRARIRCGCPPFRLLC